MKRFIWILILLTAFNFGGISLFKLIARQLQADPEGIRALNQFMESIDSEWTSMETALDLPPIEYVQSFLPEVINGYWTPALSEDYLTPFAVTINRKVRSPRGSEETFDYSITYNPLGPAGQRLQFSNRAAAAANEHESLHDFARSLVPLEDEIEVFSGTTAVTLQSTVEGVEGVDCVYRYAFHLDGTNPLTISEHISFDIPDGRTIYILIFPTGNLDVSIMHESIPRSARALYQPEWDEFGGTVQACLSAFAEQYRPDYEPSLPMR